jgi:hypothetical protein
MFRQIAAGAAMGNDQRTIIGGGGRSPTQEDHKENAHATSPLSSRTSGAKSAAQIRDPSRDKLKPGACCAMDPGSRCAWPG